MCNRSIRHKVRDWLEVEPSRHEWTFTFAITTSRTMVNDFVFKLFARTPEHINNDDTIEYRRVKFSALGGDIKDILLWPAASCEKSSSEANSYYRTLLERASVYYSPCNDDANITKLRMFYQDDDKDWVLIGSTAELVDAMLDVLNRRPRCSSLVIRVEIRHTKGDGNAETYDNYNQDECFSYRPALLRVVQVYFVVVCVAIACLGAVFISAFWIAASHSQWQPLYQTTSTETVNEQRNVDKTCQLSMAISLKNLELTTKNFPDITHYDHAPPYLKQAYQWLLQDPHRHRYPRERLRQRLGLAALYYAAQGEHWKRSDSWLSYSIHECSWWPGGDRATTSICGGGGNGAGGEDWQYKELWMTANGLEGQVPAELFTLLPNLQTIKLDRNIWLSGSLPSEIGIERHLRQLWIHENVFSGSLPSELGQLTGLQKLSLAANNFGGKIAPATVENLSSLKKLWLDHNSFTGVLPVELRNLPLKRMSTSHNNFQRGGFSAELMSSLTDLEVLVATFDVPLPQDDFDVVLPTELGLMINLRHLELYIPEATRSSISEHKWQRSEIGLLHRLYSLRVASEGGEELTDVLF